MRASMSHGRHLVTALLLASLVGCAGASASPSTGGAKVTAEAESLSARVIALIVRETGAPEERVTPKARFSEDLGLDELDMITIVMKLEDEFEIEFTDEAFDRMVTVGDVIEYVRTHA